MTRRVLAIEEIIREVVVDELPKRRDDDTHKGRGFYSMHPMWKAGLFQRVDNWSREPGMPLALGDPSDDALAIEQVWLGIDPASLDISAYGVTTGFEIALRDPKRSGADYANRYAHVCETLWRTIYSAAVQRRAPDWTAEVHFERVCGDRGRPALWRTVSRKGGENKDGKPWFITSPERVRQSGRTYAAGTFCKLNWVSDAADLIEARLRYALWHAFLAELSARLAQATKIVVVNGERRVVPLLDTIDPRSPLAAPTPWATPAQPSRTLLATHGPVRMIPVGVPLAA